VIGALVEPQSADPYRAATERARSLHAAFLEGRAP
jgi:hypothetical protein